MSKLAVLLSLSLISSHFNAKLINSGTTKRGFNSEAIEYSVYITSFVNVLVSYGGGTLISNTVVLTQAEVVAGRTGDILFVGFGAVDQHSSQYVVVTERVLHPAYDPTTKPQRHDIALLRLAQSVDTSE